MQQPEAAGGGGLERGKTGFFYRKITARTAVGDGRAGRRGKRKKKIIIYRIAIDNWSAGTYNLFAVCCLLLPEICSEGFAVSRIKNVS
jgi:hypothetical protein